MKIAFLDNAFHLRTKSSLFFVELLERLGTVVHFHVNIYELSMAAEIATADFDLVVLWQTEYFAPYFLSCGKKTVVIPMYDGCAGASNLYWQSMREARAVNFCQKLHFRHQSLGLSSFYARYFPDPSAIVPVTDFSSLRGFLWQRRPDQKIDWRLAYALIPQGMDSLHVHLVSDHGHNEDPPPPITLSWWADDKNAYGSHMAQANLFFASRRTEGIGMSTLEAMAMGMCVVANDDATANEYIIDKQNGRLFTVPSNPGENVKALKITPAAAERMGRSARHSVELGRERFLEGIDDLLAHIAATPLPSPDYGKRIDEEQLLRLAQLYIQDIGRHERRLRKLNRLGSFVVDIHDLTLTDRIVYYLNSIRSHF